MTIRVKVTLFSILKTDRFSEANIDLVNGASVDDLLSKLGLTRPEVGIVVINSKNGAFTQVLNAGDHITLIPPIGGG